MPKSAAEATPPTGNRFVEFDEFIDYQLNKASKSIQTTDVLVGFVGAGLGLTVYLFLFILADHWLVPGGLPSWARIAWWGIGLVALGYWTVTRLVRPLNGQVNVLFAARQIEKTQPALKSSLLTLTDLKQAGRPTPGLIRGSLEKRAAIGLSKADVDEAVDRGTLMTCSYALLFLLAVFCGYALFSPKSILQSAWRALVPFTTTGVATKTRIDRVNPGDADVPALSHLDVEVEVSGQAPKEATLFYTSADGAFVNEPLPLRDTGEGLRRYRGTLIGPDGRGLRQNLTYHVVAGDAQSPTYSVRVIQSPSAIVDSVDYEYQPYTGLAPKTEPGGAIDAWEGTRVTINATATQKVKSAMVLFSDTEDTSVKAEEQPMIVTEGTKLKATWQLAFRSDPSIPRFPKFYRIQVTTEDGHHDPLPTLQPLNIRPDLPPKVEVLLPRSDIQAPVNGVVGIAYRASDPDFKLHSLILNLEHDGQILLTSPRLFTGPPDEESRQGTYTLRLKDLNLAAGSRLTYWLEARDDFTPFGDRGPNRTVTPRLNIDLVDPKPPAETQQQEQQAEQEAQQALDEARQEQAQPPGAEEMGQERPEAPRNASDAKPSNEPNQAPGQDAEQQPGEKQDGPQGDPESAGPGDPSAPMPGDRAKDSPREQQPGEANPQPNNDQSGNDTGEKQPGDNGASADNAESGGKKPGTEQRSGRTGDQRGNASDPQTDQSRTQQQPSGPREKAPDDTAIQKLLEWHQEQQQKEQQRRQAESADPSQPDANRPGDDPGNMKEEVPGAQDPKTDPTGPSRAMKEGSGQPSPGSGSPPNSERSKDDSTTGESRSKREPGDKPTGEPMEESSTPGDRPSSDDRKGMDSGQTPGASQSPSASGGKNDPPNPGDSQSPTNKPGEPAGEPSESERPDRPGATPDAAPKSRPDSTNPGAGQPENSPQSPMGDKAGPDRKSGAAQQQEQKPGSKATNSSGEQSPDGPSGDRTQPREQTRSPQDKPGNSSQKPAGQSDEMGTREQGAGDPGSSTPGDSAGQKSPGQGEGGKNGEQSASGEKSGTGQSADGDKTSDSGDQPGGSKSGDGSPMSPDAKRTSSDQASPPEGRPQDGGGNQTSGDRKNGDSPQSEGGNQQSQGGPNSEKGSGQNSSGDQQGAGQKSQDGGGQQAGSGEPSGSGKPSGSKSGSQTGSTPGAGGSGSSGEAAPSPEGSESDRETESSRPDPANLENRKKATNLALKRLQETLERGEIDPELQKELGYTDEELRSFMERLQERLADTGDDNSPQAQARRRQFEQLLKGINLQTETSNRATGGESGPSSPGFGTSSRPVPQEYRAAEQRYRESLNRKK